MDTTLENQRVKPIHIISYGFVAEIIPIAALLLYILFSRDGELSASFMQETGFMILLSVGFFSFLGISFWIAKRNKHKTFLNGVLLAVTGIVFELLFYFIIQVNFQAVFIFSFLGKFVAVMIAGVTPITLKGTKDRRPTDDHDHKDL